MNLFLFLSSLVLMTPLSFSATHHFAVISDLNGSYGSTSYSSSVKKAVGALTSKSIDVEFVISTGDMVAGQKSGLNYQAMWDGFHKNVTNPLFSAGIPFFPSPGNHDAYISRKTERDIYQRNWLGKNNPLSNIEFSWVKGVSQNYPFQYAFKVGNGLFISIDNTNPTPWKDSTLKWLEEVLHKESKAKFKIVYGHIPLLPFAFKKETEYLARGNQQFLEAVESLFEEYQVTAFLSGHSHVYYPGARDNHTRFISVPLLGSGTRYLIGLNPNQRSETGFLVFEYDDQSENWSFRHYGAKDLKIVSDLNFPEEIRMPKNNGSLCKGCQNFPVQHFLESSRRVLYRRQDLY